MRAWSTLWVLCEVLDGPLAIRTNDRSVAHSHTHVPHARTHMPGTLGARACAQLAILHAYDAVGPLDSPCASGVLPTLPMRVCLNMARTLESKINWPTS